MNCAEFEVQLCDYLDGVLPASGRASLEEHMAGCAGCAELARDAGAGMAFLERAAGVETPPELLTRILFEIRSGKHGRLPIAQGIRSWFGHVLEPVLQPRFAMGMAMTILSFSMMARCAGLPKRPLQPSDLNPVAVWTTVEDRAQRTWDRAVKYYESLRFVYEIRSRFLEWSEQQAQEDRAGAGQESDERRLPVAGETQNQKEQPSGETR